MALLGQGEAKTPGYIRENVVITMVKRLALSRWFWLKCGGHSWNETKATQMGPTWHLNTFHSLCSFSVDYHWGTRWSPSASFWKQSNGTRHWMWKSRSIITKHGEKHDGWNLCDDGTAQKINRESIV